MLFSEAFAYRANYLKRIEEIEAPFIQRLNVLRQMMVEAGLLGKWYSDRQGGGVEWDDVEIYFKGHTDTDEFTPIPGDALDLTIEQYPAWIEAEIERRKQKLAEMKASSERIRKEKEAIARLEQEQREYEIYLKIKEQVEKGAKREG